MYDGCEDGLLIRDLCIDFAELKETTISKLRGRPRRAGRNHRLHARLSFIMLSLSFLPSAAYFSAYPAYPNIRSTRLTCLARKQERKELRERKRLIGSYVRRLAECDDGDDAAEVTDGCPADAWVKCARTMRLLDEMREQDCPFPCTRRTRRCARGAAARRGRAAICRAEGDGHADRGQLRGAHALARRQRRSSPPPPPPSTTCSATSG